MALTQRQRRVLDYIARFMEDRGHCPSYEEIGKGLSLSSPATIHKHICTLQKKGFLVRGTHQSRSIELTQKFKAERKAARSTGLPLMGRIAAGRPVEAVENPESISLADFAGNPDVFVLEVRGDSMIDDHIMEGDYILVDRRGAARDGDIVVALIDGQEATLKRWYREGDNARLQPANAAMSPIIVPLERLQLQGRVIGVLRRYPRI
jgi:repressor LexA